MDKKQSFDDSGCVACFEAFQAKIEKFVKHHKAIRFVIPAFPAKSPNRKKVLGALPDLGEHAALDFLQSLCDYVRHFYAPGAHITICSDGHVFSDVIGVDDGTVTAYRKALEEMIRRESWTSLDLFGLDDAFGDAGYPKLRAVLERDYSDTLAQLKGKIREDDATRSLFNGIHRFMFEDALGMREDVVSKTKLRAESKDSAYQTIRRSNAWSRVVSEKFPDAMRLSIHPQAPHSEKFGINLMRARDQWLTPWHGVVLDDGTNLSLVKRWEAEEVDASVIWRDGRPSHFVAPHLTINS
ncbi:L-tyrosine/L-tryptophan isonitrile synthase family protein [Saccharothrix sp. Mg75]|uniref:L-tyrosine/L-tryptophan isonitrile synthase family protein n=1 Tax=Saccharothrix sp. Mg75 TaxID=3445357 RepID=UPI003EED2EAC